MYRYMQMLIQIRLMQELVVPAHTEEKFLLKNHSQDNVSMTGDSYSFSTFPSHLAQITEMCKSSAHRVGFGPQVLFLKRSSGHPGHSVSQSECKSKIRPTYEFVVDIF